MEYRDGKPRRGYAKVIEDYNSNSLKEIFDIHINKEAKITTDGWSGYKLLVKNHPNFKQKLSVKGQIFKVLHIIFKSETSKTGLEGFTRSATKAI